MSKIEVDAIDKQSGSTLTLGGSGTAVTLASGATQSGFGRSGSVNWDTTAKTASFTAVSGNGYFVNTTSGSITFTLPASPSAGDIVAINDYARTFGTNNVTVGRNGSNIQGIATDATIATDGQSSTFVYVDGTKGWVPTEDQTTGMYGALYVTATGGTVTCCGDYKVHTFTGPGTFTVTCAGNSSGSTTVDYLIIAGGGGGGAGCVNSNWGGGGGGAGGTRFSNGTASGCYTAGPAPLGASALPVSATAYPITVGGGGAAGTTSAPKVRGTQGSNAIFSTITSTGGGGGGTRFGSCVPGVEHGGAGGSGGGASGENAASNPNICAGAGNTPPVSPSQGNPGGAGNWTGGGGGGATAAGTTGAGPATVPTSLAGVSGGSGVTSCITFSPVGRGGGGGSGGAGQTACTSGPAPSSTGGAGADGGGNGGAGMTAAGTRCASAATANTGGGGGGAGGGAIITSVAANGAAGGSGIVIIRYKFQ